MRSLLALAVSAATLAGGFDDSVVQRYHVRIDWTELRAPSCEQIEASAPEPARTGLDFSYEIPPPRPHAGGGFEGRPVFRLEQVVIEAPRVVSWPNMSATDRARAEAFRHALFHHEVGHVVTAEETMRALQSEPLIVAPDIPSYVDAAKEDARAGEARFKHDQDVYEALSDHGRAQRRVPPPLGGRDTILFCVDR
ncbi:MAG TPA: hypothetical protein VFB22_17875 [Candidatus Baltobacteraceae bacterium]|nr:hypothetical protein [Candidatus Baltobacteraceae bacterium]